VNLFWKIFITFGVAMVLTLVGAVFVSFRLVGQAFDQLNIENREQIIAEAAEALENGGETGLKEWLREHPRPAPGTMLMVVDENREDLLGRQLPQRFSRLLSSRSRRPRNAPRNLRPIQLTPNLVGADGQEYRLLWVRTQITVLGMLTWPATQVAVLAMVVIAAAATSLPLARYLSSPIVRLQRASRALAAGALETRVGAPFDRRRDEVGTLARDFDAMAEQIQALVTDKETLLRDVSHELRSPLARIRVALALAQRKAGDAPQTDLTRIETEAESLDDLIGQILTLSQLRTQVEQQVAPVDITALVAEIIDNARFEYPDTQIRYVMTQLPEVSGNAGELKSAIENVVRNALNYSSAGQIVDVQLVADSQRIEIRVLDQGPGIAKPDLKRIFEPFFRADQSRDHQQSGQGIGLAITASVLERHGGKANARNRPEGGLEVTLELPVSRSDTAYSV